MHLEHPAYQTVCRQLRLLLWCRLLRWCLEYNLQARRRRHALCLRRRLGGVRTASNKRRKMRLSGRELLLLEMRR